ncbi:MAG: diguanylate cyclase domain-containing protein [Erysipelotrichaceae bacterium]
MNITKYKKQILGGLFILLSLCIVMMLAPTLNDEPFFTTTKQESQSYNFGWEMTTSTSNKSELVELPFSVDKNLEYNAVITLTQTITSLPYKNVALQTMVFNRPISIYLDDSLLYQYDPQTDGIKEAVGSSNIFVPLENARIGSVIRIEYINRVPKETARIQRINLVNATVSNAADTYMTIVSNMLCMFGLVFGFIIMLYAAITRKRNDNALCLFLIGAFLFFSTLWISCNTKYIQAFITNILFIHKLEIISFFILPSILWGIFLTRWPELNRFVFPIFAFMTGFVCIIFVCDAFNILDGFYFLDLFNRIGFINLIFFLLISIQAFIKKVHSYQSLILGMAGLGLILFLDLTLHYSFKNYAPIVNNYIFGAVGLGIIFFYTYVKQERDTYTMKIKQETTMTLSRMHPLSHLKNDIALQQDLSELPQDVIVIAFSLNDLQKFNQQYGFQAGNQIIQDFTNLLTQVFQSKAEIYHLYSNHYYVMLPKKEEALLFIYLDRIMQAQKANPSDYPLTFEHSVKKLNEVLFANQNKKPYKA